MKTSREICKLSYWISPEELWKIYKIRAVLTVLTPKKVWLKPTATRRQPLSYYGKAVQLGPGLCEVTLPGHA